MRCFQIYSTCYLKIERFFAGGLTNNLIIILEILNKYNLSLFTLILAEYLKMQAWNGILEPVSPEVGDVGEVGANTHKGHTITELN